MSDDRECEWCRERKASVRDRVLIRKLWNTGIEGEEKWVICDDCVDQV
jgi:hypothetical protein